MEVVEKSKPTQKGRFWCHIRKDFFSWDELIAYYQMCDLIEKYRELTDGNNGHSFFLYHFQIFNHTVEMVYFLYAKLFYELVLSKLNPCLDNS